MSDKEKRNPSIVDVAHKAGVSAGTVSRVINRNPKISAATVKRVVSAMSDLGYEPPHPTRRRGKSSRAQQGIHCSRVAVVPLDNGTGLHREEHITKTWSGIQKCLDREDLSMVVASVSNLSRLPAILDPKQTDGVILEGAANPEELRRAFGEMAAVYIFDCPPNLQEAPFFDQVLPDNEAIGRLAVEHLREKDRKRLAAIQPDASHPGFVQRVASFAEAAGESCLTIAQADASSTPFSLANPEEQRRQIETLVTRMLKMEERPDALFLPSDHVTCLVQVQLMRNGIVPGKDISIVSCNNEESLLSALYPRPATIDIRPELIGDRAVQQLLIRMANRDKPPGERVIVPPKLLEGDM